MKKLSTFNSQLPTSRGFTLIEFLTVTVVISVIGLVIVGILNTSLRTTKKTNIANSVRVNGNQAINKIVKTIGYARKFEGVALATGSFTTNCIQPTVLALTPTPTLIPYKRVKVTGSDGIRTTFSCGTDTFAEITQATSDTSEIPSLIDTTLVKVVTGKCLFTCVQDRITSDPIIGVSFQLEQVPDGSLTENKAIMSFETSVTFRNLIK